MAKLTFLHTGDIHLGAPIRGLHQMPESWASRLLRAIPEAFDRVIRLAIANAVDFVIIAGDSFDTSRASLCDYNRFFAGLARLHEAGIPAFIVTGNHDPYTSWANDLDMLPPSAKLMGVGAPEFALFERDGAPLCLLGARSYYNQTWNHDKDIAEGISREAAIAALAPENPQVAAAPFAVGILHTGLDLDPRKAPATEADLLSRGMDYWACGHMHQRLVRPNEHDPRIVFPGCIQGRVVRETGPRGCFLVTLENGEGEGEGGKGRESGESGEGGEGLGPSGRSAVALEFHPTASVVFQQLVIDASPFRTLPDLVQHIQGELFRANGQAHCEEMIMDISLAGPTVLYDFLAQPSVVDRLRKRLNDGYPSFYVDTVENLTRPPQEETTTQTLMDNTKPSEPDLFSSLVRSLASDQRIREDEMLNYIQSEFVKLGIAVPETLPWTIGVAQDQAELLILRLLTDDSAEEAGL